MRLITLALERTSAIGGASGTTGRLYNYGTITNSYGVSTISVAIGNVGTISVLSGTLDFEGAVSNTGKATVQGKGVLEFDGAVGAQAVTFGTGGGTLRLEDAPAFAGSIAKLGAGDTIDVDGLGSGTTFSSAENAGKTQGVLTLTHGATVDKLTLIGNYSSSGFKLTTGKSGDTLVTYATPKPKDAPAGAADLTQPHAASLARSLFEAAFAPAGFAETIASTHEAGLAHPMAASSLPAHAHA